MFYDNSGAPVRKHYTLDEFGESTLTGIGAAFKQSWTESFSPAMYRNSELIRANIGEGEVKYLTYSPSLGYEAPVTGTEKKLTNEQAQEKIKSTGLPLTAPDEGYTQTALDLVIERKKSELIRKKQMEDATGFVAGTGKIVAGIAGQIMDPVNIAASFVPVVGQARYAAMLAKASGWGGRAAIRAGVGAVEGGVGAAALEPLIYEALTREQADYDMGDSLLNIGLGTVLGGGLHMGLGAASDALKARGSRTLQEPQGSMAEKINRAAPETREQLLKTSLAMEAQGYHPELSGVMATDPNLNAVTQGIRAEQAEGMYSAYTGTLSRMKRKEYRSGVSSVYDTISSIDNIKGVNQDIDSLGEAITKLGGINRKAALADGMDEAEFRKNRAFSASKGSGFDEMAELLNQYGYRSADGSELDANSLAELVINGDRDINSIFSSSGKIDENTAIIKELRSQGYSSAEIKNALNKSLSGSKLGSRQTEIVEGVLYGIEDSRAARAGDLQARRTEGEAKADQITTPEQAELEITNIIGDQDLSDSNIRFIEKSIDLLEDEIITPQQFVDRIKGELGTPMPSHVNESQAMQNSVRDGFAVENMRGVDKSAALEADEMLLRPERDIDQEMSELEDFYAEYQQMTGDTTDFKLFDESIAKAEEDAAALKAATLCRLTK